jgi:Nif-specific regulatory protein
LYIVLQHHSGNGSSWKLGPEPLIIGRSEGCDIRMFDASMSRRHAKIWLDGGIARVEDLRSSNSTLVNGIPVEFAALQPGDVLAAGIHRFHITDVAPPETERNGGPDSTPITLSAGLTTYTRDPQETHFEAPTQRTIQELHELFHLGLALGAVESIYELALLLERTLRDQFEPVALWVAWRYASDQPLVFQALESNDPNEIPPLKLLEGAIERREGLIKPSVHRDGEKRLPQTHMAAPMIHADQVLGGFAICGRAPIRTYAEDDLHYALGIAAIAAPHVRAVRHAEQLRRDNEALLARAGSGAQLLGQSPAISQARDILARAGASTLPVLILGETGTGKEIAARMLHEASPRHDGPYVVVNCAAIPGDLFESEFFGHEKGAFTGATQQRPGRFEEAGGGTLFLDEIGDLSLDNQARILRAIETSTFHRVGGHKPITVDVRIVAATNKCLEEPHFRLDLLHRLNSVTVHMPPLRERPEDLPLLADHFIRLSSSHGPIHVTGLRPDTLTLLQQHNWPGNVRELKARIDRAILFAQTHELSPADFDLGPNGVSEINTPGVYDAHKINTPTHLSLAQIERAHIQRVLETCEGNIAKAARTLGINRVTLYKRIAEYGGK